MMHTQLPNARRSAHVQRSAQGISLVETVLALMILAGAFVASMNTIVSARMTSAVATERSFGLVLAEDLMDEILNQPNYQEGLLFGPDIAEQTGDRSAFDDVDDYNGWTSSPPQDASGTAIAGADVYTREVSVNYVKRATPFTTSLTDRGLVLITVTVKRGDKQVATLQAHRSDVQQLPMEGY